MYAGENISSLYARNSILSFNRQFKIYTGRAPVRPKQTENLNPKNNAIHYSIPALLMKIRYALQLFPRKYGLSFPKLPLSKKIHLKRLISTLLSEITDGSRKMDLPKRSSIVVLLICKKYDSFLLLLPDKEVHQHHA